MKRQATAAGHCNQQLAVWRAACIYACVKTAYLLALAAFLTTSAATATTIDLTGVIRDFKGFNEPGGHPDFETTIGALQTGAVGGILSAGLPVFTGSHKAGFTNAQNFDEWYRDTPGVNTSSTLTIALTDAGTPGVYSYTNTNFFPIDNKLFGNTPGWNHNYHFTYDIHSTFGFQGGEKFTFIGDDDVWVFLNNKLAVDLGGVHSSQTGSFTLNPATAANLGLAAGNQYAFDLFFAERHTSQSTFHMDTTMDLQSSTPDPPTVLLLGGGISFVALKRRKREPSEA